VAGKAVIALRSISAVQDARALFGVSRASARFWSAATQRNEVAAFGRDERLNIRSGFERANPVTAPEFASASLDGGSKVFLPTTFVGTGKGCSLGVTRGDWGLAAPQHFASGFADGGWEIGGSARMRPQPVNPFAPARVGGSPWCSAVLAAISCSKEYFQLRAEPGVSSGPGSIRRSVAGLPGRDKGTPPAAFEERCAFPSASQAPRHRNPVQ
jgi:hypothetical protein